MIDFSVIIPVDRGSEEARSAIASLLDQKTEAVFEIIVVGPAGLELPSDERIRFVESTDRNPARRRNLAARAARGDILAFIDDDAAARADWLQNALAFFESHPRVLALGGPDPAPADSSGNQLISDTLLATPFIGSGVACHENRPGTFRVRAAHDIALVNLFVRRDAFLDAGELDESIGYIGEDSALVQRLIDEGEVFYSSSCVVFHRRRDFPGAYLRQRWRYRVKTGEMLVRGGRHYRNAKVFAFLAAGVLFFVLLVLRPSAAAIVFAAYLLLTLILGATATRLPKTRWLVIPFAFACHHATYFGGIVWGVMRALTRRAGARREADAGGS